MESWRRLVNPVIRKFLGVLLFQGSSFSFALAVTLGLGLSTAVILTTIGLMDGFEKTLKTGLRRSNGDILLRAKGGFLNLDQTVKAAFKENNIENFTGIVESEGFSLYEERSKGVLIKGIEKDSFEKVLGLSIEIQPHEIAIGRELAEFYGIKKGQSLILSILGSSVNMGEIPTLREFVVGDIIQHDIYQKDLRYVYMEKRELQEILGVENLINGILLKSPREDIEGVVKDLKSHLGQNFYISPFWSEFSILLKAVKAEKFMIGLVLQIIVVIATFNVLAYIFFLSARRSKEIFLFRALGMSQRLLTYSWGLFIGFLWLGSCLFSFIFYNAIKYGIENFESLALPSDVYYLMGLKLFLSSGDCAFVLLLSLLWMVLITFFSLSRLHKSTLIQGLKQEFS